MRKLTIAVDVDDVCADLLSEWLRRYNVDFKDALLPEDIDRWELKDCVKPEAKKAIYGYLREPDLYEHIKPIPGARQAVFRLRAMGHRVVFVTSCVRGTVDRKVEWLVRWGFLPQTHTQPDFYAASDKALIAADVLVDDHVVNVEAFPGPALLVTRPHNAQLPTTRLRIRGLEELVEMVEQQEFLAALYVDDDQQDLFAHGV
jgi:5'-nucleotidase